MELENALKGGDSIVQDIIDKTNRLEVMKNDIQKQLDETKLRIRNEEEAIENLGNQGNRVRQDADKLRAEVRTLEANMAATEEDKITKDNQIRTLKEEILHQDELVSRLQKDKRAAQEARQKTEEGIQALEDKANHINKLKVKLEQALDECEDALEREKKGKNDVEKSKRKVEGD